MYSWFITFDIFRNYFWSEGFLVSIVSNCFIFEICFIFTRLFQYNTIQYNTIQYNTIILYCPVNGKLVYSVRIKKFVKYNRDKKNNKKQNKKTHLNSLPTNVIIIMVVANISHGIHTVTYRLHRICLKKSVREMCRL